MNLGAGHDPAAPIIKSKAEVIKTHAIEIETLPAWSENSYELWCEIQHLPQFRFLLLKPLFGQSTFRYIHDCADRFLIAAAVSQRVRKTTNVFYRTIRHQQPMLEIKVTSALSSPLKDALEKFHIVRMDSP